MLAATETEASPKMSKSFAKRRWWIGEHFLAILRPFKLLFLSSLNMSLEKTSTSKMKRKWERGSPCLNPLPGEKRPKGLLFKRIEKEVDVIHILIHESQVGVNPSFSKIARRKLYSILSKAFSMSIFMNIKPPLPLLGLKACRSSWAIMVLSWIFLLGTKADCNGQIILGRNLLNLLAKTFEIIL